MHRTQLGLDCEERGYEKLSHLLQVTIKPKPYTTKAIDRLITQELSKALPVLF